MHGPPRIREFLGRNVLLQSSLSLMGMCGPFDMNAGTHRAGWTARSEQESRSIGLAVGLTLVLALTVAAVTHVPDTSAQAPPPLQRGFQLRRAPAASIHGCCKP